MIQKAYKLLRIRKSNNTLGPLFINKRQVIPIGPWMRAEAHRTKNFVFRPGWHCSPNPSAPHLGMKGRRWYEVEIRDFVPLKRPVSQGGTWYLAQRMRVVREYRE